MMKVVSKLLLLVTLFIGIENAVSRSDSSSRELSFDHLPVSLPRSSLNSLGNGKSSKSSKSNNGSDGVKSSKSDQDKSATKSSKAVRNDAPPSPPPTEIGTFGVEVPVYSLVYTLVFNNKPTIEELDQLNEATRSYLDDYFTNEFDDDDFTIYSQFVNQIEETTSISNMEVAVSFDSIVRFGQLSLIKPMPNQLGSSIDDAFTGLKMIEYENWLTKMLPQENVFVGSKVQYYNGDAVPGTSISGMAGIAASAAAVTLLVASLVLYKSKPEDRGNYMGKLNKSPADLTVAGETYAGETYDGMASISASADGSRKVNDEENGRQLENLESINEISAEANKDKAGIFRLAPNKILGAFRSSSKAAKKTSSFEDVALQAPTSGDKYEDNLMPDPSSSDDDDSQMSDSELSQFVANQTAGGHKLEIKSILSQDSMDENAVGDLSVRDNSSRRLRTVAEIEALLSSELNDDNSGSGSRTSRSTIQAQLQMDGPRTVEEIESLLTAEDDESILGLPAPYEDDSSTDDSY